MTRLLATVLVLATAVVAAYAAVLGWYDGDRIRSLVTERMLTRHGLVVQMDRLERSFSPRPLIRVDGMRVANAKRRNHQLVEVDTATFRLHPLSAIAGPLTLDDIVVDGLRLTVPVSDQGALYWDPLVDAVSEWLRRFDWSLRRFEIRNLRSDARNIRNENDFLVSARHVSGAMASPAELTLVASDVTANLETTLPLRLSGTARLKRVELGRQPGELPVTLEAEGSIGDEVLRIEAAGENVLEGDPLERDRLQVRIRLGDAVARTRGTISRDDPLHLDLLTTLDKPGENGEPDLHVEFRVSDPHRRWRFSIIRASLGESTLTGEIDIARRGDRRFFGASVAMANVRYPEDPEADASSEKDATGLLPAGDLYSNLLRLSQAIDTDLHLRAETSTFWGIPFEELALSASLDGGELAAEIEKASISDAALSGKLSIKPTETETLLELEASLQDAPVSALLAGLEDLEDVTGQFNGYMELRASGEETSSVLGSTAGRMVFFLEDGTMPDELATRVAGDVLAAMFEDFEADDTTPIHCALADFSVTDGLARSQRMILDTGEFNLYGKGEIRFDEQKLDIELVPYAKDFSLVSMRLPLRIHGSFDDIRLEKDVAEGAASLLTPIELGGEDDTSCTPPPVSAAIR